MAHLLGRRFFLAAVRIIHDSGTETPVGAFQLVLSLRQFDRHVRFKDESASPPGDQSDLRAFLSHSLAQQNQPALQVVLDFWEPEPGVHSEFPVGELGTAVLAMLREQAPEDAARHVTNQVLPVHKDTVVSMKEAEVPAGR